MRPILPYRRSLRVLLAGAVGSLAAMLAAAWLIQRAADGRVSTSQGTVPSRQVGIVLGCSPTLRSGDPNAFFEYRMQAAADLFRSGRVRFLLLSGDNHRVGYDEPTAMRKALLRLGVPDDRLVLDYAGFSTFDSIVRARRVFGLSEAVVISQRDHVARAIFLGDRTGLHLDGYAAADVPLAYGLRTRVREALARVRALLDVTVLGRRPHFLGPPVTIGPG